jgi:hypothetical protein
MEEMEFILILQVPLSHTQVGEVEVLITQMPVGVVMIYPLKV